jgi:CAI-1 autoinducer synthase
MTALPASQLQPAEGARTVLPVLEQRMNSFYNNRWREQWKGRHIMRGRQPGVNSIQLMSNDYLALAGHEHIRHAQIRMLEDREQDVLMSGVFLGEGCSQHQFEQRVADWSGFPSAVLCQSGYAANVGLLQAVTNQNTPVYIDMKAHASLWEGIQSAGARACPFRHNNVGHLERQIRVHGPGLICIDSVYSTSGALAPVAKMVALARQTGCMILVDESHSLGTHGPGGSGLVAELGLQSQVDFVTASLAKAFAGRAGIILCADDFPDYFWFTARPAIFSSCLLGHEVAGLNATLDLVIEDDWRRRVLGWNSEYLRQGLSAAGFNVEDSQSQIIALEAGDEYTTLRMREALEREDIFGAVFCAPATARNRSMIRLSVNAGLTIDELERIILGCTRAGEATGMHQWASARRLQRGVRAEVA